MKNIEAVKGNIQLRHSIKYREQISKQRRKKNNKISLRFDNFFNEFNSQCDFSSFIRTYFVLLFKYKLCLEITLKKRKSLKKFEKFHPKIQQEIKVLEQEESI